MPLPLLLGVAAIVAGTSGVGLGIHGGIKIKEANDKLNEAENRNKRNQELLTRTNVSSCRQMDILGTNEIGILSDFKYFSELFEKIHNKPEFTNLSIGNVQIPNFKGTEIKKASVGASVLIGGLGGAALGTAGGFAASGATSAAVMALGTASTGTLISSLSGAAATNATLAALGGGSLAAGGGGIAAGTMVLGATTLGVGLLVGGIIFTCTGSSISNKADKAWEQMLSNERTINNLCTYLNTLRDIAFNYNCTLMKMRTLYFRQLKKMRVIVEQNIINGHVSWDNLSGNDQLIINNMVLIVSVLFKMCKVKIVKKSDFCNINVINGNDINDATNDATKVISALG